MSSTFCVVWMPFGTHTDDGARPIDFEMVFRELIAPVLREAAIDVVRTDDGLITGEVTRSGFEKLVLSPLAIADVTLANPRALYQLGARDAMRSRPVVLVSANETRSTQVPRSEYSLSYEVSWSGELVGTDPVRSRLAEMLRAETVTSSDLALFELLDDLPHREVSHRKVDVFRDRVAYSSDVKSRFASARKAGSNAVAALERDLGPIKDLEAATLIDLYLSYRATQDWQRMVLLARKMPRHVAQTTMVQEQLAFGLNRLQRWQEAESVLQLLIATRGASSENLGLLGRVYKDRWEAAAADAHRVDEAAIYLRRAIDAYLRGFQIDPKDTYPGVNAVTLMEIHEPPDSRGAELLPVVRFAAGQRLAASDPDYWDYATTLEVAVLSRDEKGAREVLPELRAHVREGWEPTTTARNLSLIFQARNSRGEHASWAEDIETEVQSMRLP